MFLEITAFKDTVRKNSELLYVTLQNLRLMNKFEKRKLLIRGGRGMMLYIRDFEFSKTYQITKIENP